MCPYALLQENENGTTTLMCEPKKEMCTLCVMGNHKTYKEIEEMERSRYEKGKSDFGSYCTRLSYKR